MGKPWAPETAETLDYLAEAGIEYVCDLCLDDQPVIIKASPRPVVAMPYTVEINYVVITAVQGIVLTKSFGVASTISIGSTKPRQATSRDGHLDPSLSHGRSPPN